MFLISVSYRDFPLSEKSGPFFTVFHYSKDESSSPSFFSGNGIRQKDIRLYDQKCRGELSGTVKQVMMKIIQKFLNINTYYSFDEGWIRGWPRIGRMQSKYKRRRKNC